MRRSQILNELSEPEDAIQVPLGLKSTDVADLREQEERRINQLRTGCSTAPSTGEAEGSTLTQARVDVEL